MPLRLYAVIPRGGRAAGRGIDREPLRVIRLGKLALVVGEARIGSRPDRAQLLRYDRVVCRLAATVRAIVPARFGVVLTDEAELRAQASRRGLELHEALQLVAGREQMTLRLRFAPGVTPSVSEGTGLRAALSGRQYLDSRAAALRPPPSPELDQLRIHLAPLVRAERYPGRREADEVTLYHLIDRGAARAYRSALRDAARDFPRVRLSHSGPFPPYAFAPGLLG